MTGSFRHFCHGTVCCALMGIGREPDGALCWQMMAGWSRAAAVGQLTWKVPEMNFGMSVANWASMR